MYVRDIIRNMISVYFSGTGNSKHCAEYLLQRLDLNGTSCSIEDENAVCNIKNNDAIVFAYPVYYSDLPKIVGNFIVENSEIWKNKKIFIVATMGLFSGDGAGCAARLFKKYGAEVLGGLHIKMPDCIGDVKILKKSLQKNCKTVKKANEKIDKAVKKIQINKYPQNGLSFACRLAGLFGQRLYFRKKTKNYYSGIKADYSKCISCGLCVSVCPMQNIKLAENKISFNDKCTMCYRCFSKCPEQAITVIGKKVYEQCSIEKYKFKEQNDVKKTYAD